MPVNERPGEVICFKVVGKSYPVKADQRFLSMYGFPARNAFTTELCGSADAFGKTAKL